jgi:hypothetical protein
MSVHTFHTGALKERIGTKTYLRIPDGPLEGYLLQARGADMLLMVDGKPFVKWALR